MEHRVAVEARHAAPQDPRLLIDQRADRTVSDHRQVERGVCAGVLCERWRHWIRRSALPGKGVRKNIMGSVFPEVRMVSGAATDPADASTQGARDLCSASPADEHAPTPTSLSRPA